MRGCLSRVQSKIRRAACSSYTPGVLQEFLAQKMVKIRQKDGRERLCEHALTGRLSQACPGIASVHWDSAVRRCARRFCDSILPQRTAAVNEKISGAWGWPGGGAAGCFAGPHWTSGDFGGAALAAVPGIGQNHTDASPAGAELNGCRSAKRRAVHICAQSLQIVSRSGPQGFLFCYCVV